MSRSRAMDTFRIWAFCLLTLITIITRIHCSDGEILSTRDRVSGLEVDPALGKPRKVTAEVVGVNSIRLSWQAPHRADGKCPVRRYLIRLREEHARRSKSWKIDGERESLSLHDLEEDTLYFLRLMAVTCEGKGARTRWIEVRTGRNHATHMGTDEQAELRAPGKPSSVRTRTLSDSVLVSWQPPTDATAVRGYKVGYSQGVPDLNWRYVNATTRNLTIGGLKSGTEYVISLCAYNNVGMGLAVFEPVITSLDSYEDNEVTGPFSAPENVRAKIISSTSAWLQWTDPSLGRQQQITDSRYYNVHYQTLPHGKTLSMIVKGKLYVVLEDLTPGTMYAFKVRTVRDTHSSAFSSSAQNRTFEAVPSTAPRELSALATNDSSTVHLSWRPPRQPNGYITAYLILYSTERRRPLTEWDVFAVPGTNNQVIMSTLQTNVTYFFRVQARNSQGYGPASDLLTHHTSVTPDNSINRTPELRFEEPSQNYVEFEEYSYNDDGLQYDDDDMVDRGFDHRGTDRAGSKQSDGIETQNRELNGIQGYEPFKGEDVLDVSFQYVVKHTVTAVIRWEIPCQDTASFHRVPVEYIIRYYPIDTPWQYTEKTTPTNFVLLDNLRANQKYAYAVKRIMGDEETSWSEEGNLDTTYPNGSNQI